MQEQSKAYHLRPGLAYLVSGGNKLEQYGGGATQQAKVPNGFFGDIYFTICPFLVLGGVFTGNSAVNRWSRNTCPNQNGSESALQAVRG